VADLQRFGLAKIRWKNPLMNCPAGKAARFADPQSAIFTEGAAAGRNYQRAG
jgi:hypothetical protein